LSSPPEPPAEVPDSAGSPPPAATRAVRTLSDDSLPDASGLFIPAETTGKVFDPKEHKAQTRKALAIAALSVLGGFHAIILCLLALDVITLAELAGIVAAFSGLQTLTAVAFAFYFAKA
jgi:hypothetical protein